MISEGNKHAAHLTAEQARSIKALRGSSKSQQEVADEFGISRQQVAKIWAGQRWKDLEVA